jgi:hypothetical protein
MKVLSVRQPWAGLICSGIKDVENRVWQTNYRGTILIHATAKPDRERLHDIIDLKKAIIPSETTINVSNSAIIGTVDIVGCVPNSPSIWAETLCFHWQLKNAVLFRKPIKDVKGKLSLWEYDITKEEILERT